jgi:hypothetical protein
MTTSDIINALEKQINLLQKELDVLYSASKSAAAGGGLLDQLLGGRFLPSPADKLQDKLANMFVNYLLDWLAQAIFGQNGGQQVVVFKQQWPDADTCNSNLIGAPAEICVQGDSDYTSDSVANNPKSCPS